MALIVSTKKYRMSFGSRRTVLATGIVGAARTASVATERGELLLEETSPHNYSGCLRHTRRHPRPHRPAYAA